MNENSIIIPNLYIKSKGESTTKLALELTNVAQKCVIRLTGGCGKMSLEDTVGFNDLYRQALIGFKGAMLFGGTRMLMRDDTSIILPGITEIPSELRAACPEMKMLGVIPRTQELGISDYGLIVANDEADPYFTIVHPNQHIALVVQVSADDEEVWDAEFHECMSITDDLRRYGGFSSVLIAYNGGGVTKKEVFATANRQWPVILIKGSGRVCDELANDRDWLASHSSVIVADNNPISLRNSLVSLKVVPEQRLGLVRSEGA